VQATTDLVRREKWILGVLMALTLCGGLAPQPWLDLSAPAVEGWVRRLTPDDEDPVAPAEDAGAPDGRRDLFVRGA
jgi:NADH:ubiquinone oxidoreductase subunit 4 (subunit M)